MDADLELVANRLTGIRAALDQMIGAETSRPRHMQLVRLRGEVVSVLDVVVPPAADAGSHVAA